MNLQQHITKCPLMVVPCPNYCVDDETGIVTKMERKLVNKHLRDTCIMRTVPCKYCSFPVRPCDRAFHNSQECEGVLELCSITPVVCAFSKLGCGMLFDMEATMEQHLKDDCDYHAKLVQGNYGATKRVQDEQADKISSLQRENCKLKQELTRIHSPIKTQSYRDFEWTICGVDDKIVRRERCYSDPFNVGLYKFQAFVDWNVQGSRKCIGLYTNIMRGESDERLDWPLMYRATVSLKNLLSQGGNYVKSFEVGKKCVEGEREKRYVGYGLSNFISVGDLLNTKFCKLGTVKIEVSISTIV